MALASRRTVVGASMVSLLGLLWASAAAAVGPADPARVAKGIEQLRQMQEAFAAIADRVAPSVVAIQAKRKLSSFDAFRDNRDETLKHFGERLIPAIGSGVVIDSNGYILTNEHVVASAEELTAILFDRRRHRAKLVGSDPRSDLAVIKIEAKALSAAKLGRLASTRQGHWAIAIGNAFGLAGEGKPSMTVGIVSAIGRALPSIGGQDRHYGNLIQTSADINPGNSGGPLLNLDGEVIGINTAISSRSGVSEGVGFAVPITPRTRAIIEALKAGKDVEYGFLGVVVSSPDSAESARAGSPPYLGAFVEMVEPKTPAAKANIKAGDVVVEVDGDVIDDSDHLVRAIGASPIGRPITVVLWRDKKKLSVEVVLAKRSDMLARLAPKPDTLRWRGLTVGKLSEKRRKDLGLARDAGGVEIVAVAEKSASHAAGLKVGDVIDKLDGKPVGSLGDFRSASNAVDEAKDVVIHLVKGGTRTIKGPEKR